MTLRILLLVPLVTALLSFFVRRRAAMEAINLTGFAITFFVALALAAQVLRTGSVALWDGFLYAAHLSALVILLTASVALLCSAYAVGYLRDDQQSGALGEGDLPDAQRPSKFGRYYVLTPLFVFSMLWIAVSNNLGVMWVAIEATTLACVFLVTFYGKKTSIEAAWKYAIIGGVGLSMALFRTIVTYYSGHHLTGSDRRSSPSGDSRSSPRRRSTIRTSDLVAHHGLEIVRKPGSPSTFAAVELRCRDSAGSWDRKWSRNCISVWCRLHRRRRSSRGANSVSTPLTLRRRRTGVLVTG